MFPKNYLDQVQICTSIPGKVPIDPNKLNILWQKNSWDQPNLQKFFTNKKDMKNMIGMYLIVIGTMKNLDMLLIYLLKNAVVIKNGIDNFPIRKIYKRGTPIKLIHHCTPWRGLNVLLRAMQD